MFSIALVLSLVYYYISKGLFHPHNKYVKQIFSLQDLGSYHGYTYGHDRNSPNLLVSNNIQKEKYTDGLGVGNANYLDYAINQVHSEIFREKNM